MGKSLRRSNRALALGLASFFLSIVCQAQAQAASFALPAINSPSSAEHHIGKVIWADLVTPDLAVAEQFYGSLFGWTFQTIHTGASDYAVAFANGRPVGGLLQKAIRDGEHQQSAWLTFISVRDVETAKKAALAGGAKVVSDSRSYPARGRQTVLSDPQGAIFAILASSSGDTPDYLAAAGEWIWSSLLVKDTDNEVAFYQKVFSYDAFELASDDGRQHVILSSDDLARASVNSLPDDSAHRRAHWLNFVRVDSTADAVAKVMQTGGRVLVEPHVDRHGGQVAVVADPSGAPFGLMEWADGDSKVELK